MTPYNERSLVIIDPLLNPSMIGKKGFAIALTPLFFGEIPLELWQKEGKVKSSKYVHNKKFMSYEVEFSGESKTYWFKESELVVLYS